MLGCSDGEALEPTSEPLEPLAFESCPRFSDSGEGLAECALTELPLFEGDPASGTIPIFVKRLPATEPRRGQLWLLPGGPGSSSRIYEHYADGLSRLAPELDVYVPDHRGVGASSLLTCSSVQSSSYTAAEMDACAEELAQREALDAYRTTEAARDVLALIARTRQTGERVLVHGVSYGGYWLHRLVAMAPDAIDGAIFESTSRGVPGGIAHLAAEPDEAGRNLFALCALDPECEARLGGDPYETARAIRESSQDCDAIDAASEGFPTRLAAALADRRLRQAVPALFYRLERCNDADRSWLAAFKRAVAADTSAGLTPLEDKNPVLNWHIVASEFIGARDPEVLDEVSRDALFNDVPNARKILEVTAGWPVYDPDEFNELWAAGPVRALVLHGALDPTTAPAGARAVAEHLGADAQYVEAPYGRHGVIDPNAPESCISSVYRQFVAAPGATVDTSCLQAEPAFRFEPDSDWLLDTFRGENLWGD